MIKLKYASLRPRSPSSFDYRNKFIRSFKDFKYALLNGSCIRKVLIQNIYDFSLSLIPHPSFHIPHPSSLIPHPSSFIPKPASLVPHPSSFIPKPASLVPHPSSPIPQPSSLFPYPLFPQKFPILKSPLYLWLMKCRMYI